MVSSFHHFDARSYRPGRPRARGFLRAEERRPFYGGPRKARLPGGKVLALWPRRPWASRCFHSGKLILSFPRVPDNALGWWGNPWGFESEGLERARDDDRKGRESATSGARRSLAPPIGRRRERRRLSGRVPLRHHGNSNRDFGLRPESIFC